MAFHAERVAKIIERELSTILLMEAKNNLLKYVSITKVVATKDLSLATIWFTIRGDESEKKATIEALESAKGFLRSELSHRLDVRKTPELRFKLDESLAYGEKIDQILKGLK
jgi:ribosome-binding factor A